MRGGSVGESERRGCAGGGDGRPRTVVVLLNGPVKTGCSRSPSTGECRRVHEADLRLPVVGRLLDSGTGPSSSMLMTSKRESPIAGSVTASSGAGRRWSTHYCPSPISLRATGLPCKLDLPRYSRATRRRLHRSFADGHLLEYGARRAPQLKIAYSHRRPVGRFLNSVRRPASSLFARRASRSCAGGATMHPGRVPDLTFSRKPK